MSFFGKLARGLATGAAGYYGEVAKSQEEERKSAILAAREQALAEVNHSNRMSEAAEVGRQNRLSHSSAALDDFAGKRALLPLQAQADVDVATGKEKVAYERWKLQFPVEERAKRTLEEYRQGQETARNTDNNRSREGIANRDRVARIDMNPTSTVENQYGEVVNTFAPGGTTRVTTHQYSRFPQKGQAGSDDGTGTGIAPTRPRRPAAPAAPTLESSNTYTMEDLNYTAQKNGISVDEARKRLNGSGFRLQN